jgi:predicted RNase H-like HicB family nuclease
MSAAPTSARKAPPGTARPGSARSGHYVALCPGLDTASHGATIEEATANLREALALFLETADTRETTQRLRSGVFVTTFDVVDK